MGIPFNQLPINVQKRLREENPDAFRQVEAIISKSTPAQRLARFPPKQENGKNRVLVRVVLIALRRRILDDDNNVASFKPLRDTISRELGVDDGNPAIHFEYGQQPTDGEEGALVNIELL